ncbi:MAG TPA: hypothetical protein VGX51_03125 [Solirubrobacteraceae bacterium]|jgi:hypothetical protein|nr:hypothetical protein [Solirubrobacteraceae bacterium]
MLAMPALASAHAGSKSFAETYPVASRLCANIERGSGPKRLRASAAQVTADCSALRLSFNTAHTTVLAARLRIARTAAADRTAAALECAGALTHKPSCTKARTKETLELQHLLAQRKSANHAYYRAAESARVTFWNAIQALPGGKGIAPDKPIKPLSD